MYFRKFGNGNEIVFLHGWGCDGDIFLPIVAQLSDFSCYVPDFNGFGRSSMPPDSGWTVEDYADRLYRFFVENKLFDTTIVAHSFGCRVATVFAVKYPTLVKKLLLVAPAGVRQFNLLRWLRVRCYKVAKKLCGGRNSSSCSFASSDYRACQPCLKNTFVKVINQDLRNYAKLIAVPTLIVCGRDDKETPLKHAKLLNKCISNSILTEIDGGHFAFFANPNAFASTVRYFEGA